MSKRFIAFLVMVMATACVTMLAMPQAVRAMTISNMTITLDCTGFSWTDFDFVLDRDNTNSGQERYEITVTDGDGTVIHFFANQLGLGSYPNNGVGNANYNSGTPDYNPLTYTWKSIAGNGFAEQIAYTTTGNCAGLPTWGGTPPPTTPPPTTPPPTTPPPTTPPPTTPPPTTPPPTTPPPTTPPGVPIVVVATQAAPEAQFEPGDNRVNNMTKDRSAPVAIYCEASGIQVRVIDPASSRGIDPPAINVAFEAIAAAGVPADANLLLAEANGVQLWRLTTGEFQVNTTYANEAKPYIVVWSDCPKTDFYHLAN